MIISSQFLVIVEKLGKPLHSRRENKLSFIRKQLFNSCRSARYYAILYQETYWCDIILVSPLFVYACISRESPFSLCSLAYSRCRGIKPPRAISRERRGRTGNFLPQVSFSLPRKNYRCYSCGRKKEEEKYASAD